VQTEKNIIVKVQHFLFETIIFWLKSNQSLLLVNQTLLIVDISIKGQAYEEFNIRVYLNRKILKNNEVCSSERCFK
jgi:hypothetical protein